MSPFEASAAFRADFMFFLLRINGFVESVFWQKFFRGKPQRRKLRNYVEKHDEDLLNDGKGGMDAHLKKALTWQGREKDRPAIDCYSSGFRRLLASLPDGVKRHQADILEQEFGIFGGHDDFLKTLETFAQKRNRLEHFVETEKWGQKRRSADDGEALSRLGLYLLPQMRGMFTGSLRAAARRLGREGGLRESIEKVEALFAHASGAAREHTRQVFAEKRRRDIIVKARRKSLEESDNAYQNKLWSMCKRHVYRLGTFKRHYHFIGERALKSIEGLIEEASGASVRRRISTDETPDFRHDLEALYYLGVRINLVLHRFIRDVLDHKWEQAVNACNSKTQWDKTVKSQTETAIKNACPDLVRIRDAIAHNGLFWNVEKADGGGAYAVEEIFGAVMAALPDRQTANDFYTTVLGLCRTHSRALAFPANGTAAPESVRTWSPERRRKFLGGDYKIDKRPFLRPVVARWVIALNKAKNAQTTEKKRDKTAP